MTLVAALSVMDDSCWSILTKSRGLSAHAWIQILQATQQEPKSDLDDGNDGHASQPLGQGVAPPGMIELAVPLDPAPRSGVSMSGPVL
jgi:hypothetical protein